ncbi:hypothetical protein TNCV_2568811 [Trichonephila clavipes]|uniref:Uncharacterized protein n=1 Tax=Trichonephila clavipes TaxID=2585209 RepID=A0A8X7BNU5_TRICX|nr:hypothetical protein TNCV_2568811 [Trichonephila clavipes]
MTRSVTKSPRVAEQCGFDIHSHNPRPGTKEPPCRGIGSQSASNGLLWVLSSPVPIKTRRVGQRCTLNLSRAELSSRWCGVVVRRGGASSGVVHVT